MDEQELGCGIARQRMSEDPVKYEPMTDSAGNDIPTPSAWFGDAAGHAEREKRAKLYAAGVADGKRVAREDGRSINPSQQIRIEALRAAVRFDNLASSERAIEFAKQFAAYLESGE